MANLVLVNEEQFEDIIYRTVNRCLNEKNIGNLVEKPEDEGFYDRDEICSPAAYRISNSMAYREVWHPKEPESRAQEPLFKA